MSEAHESQSVAAANGYIDVVVRLLADNHHKSLSMRRSVDTLPTRQRPPRLPVSLPYLYGGNIIATVLRGEGLGINIHP